jgi:hypothetical protein
MTALHHEVTMSVTVADLPHVATFGLRLVSQQKAANQHGHLVECLKSKRISSAASVFVNLALLQSFVEHATHGEHKSTQTQQQNKGCQSTD